MPLARPRPGVGAVQTRSRSHQRLHPPPPPILQPPTRGQPSPFACGAPATWPRVVVPRAAACASDLQGSPAEVQASGTGRPRRRQVPGLGRAPLPSQSPGSGRGCTGATRSAHLPADELSHTWGIFPGWGVNGTVPVVLGPHLVPTAQGCRLGSCPLRPFTPLPLSWGPGPRAHTHSLPGPSAHTRVPIKLAPPREGDFAAALGSAGEGTPLSPPHTLEKQPLPPGSPPEPPSPASCPCSGLKHLEEGSLTPHPACGVGAAPSLPCFLASAICCGHSPAQGHLNHFRSSCYYNVLLAPEGDSQGSALGPCPCTAGGSVQRLESSLSFRSRWDFGEEGTDGGLRRPGAEFCSRAMGPSGPLHLPIWAWPRASGRALVAVMLRGGRVLFPRLAASGPGTK